MVDDFWWCLADEIEKLFVAEQQEPYREYFIYSGCYRRRYDHRYDRFCLESDWDLKQIGDRQLAADADQFSRS